VLPSGLGAPSDDPYAPPELTGTEVSWLQPLPDSWLDPEAEDPAAIVTAREGLRLAMIACLQFVPARQRAVLILRDVLAWPAAEVAELLGITTAAVKSMLQRARARLEEVSPAADQVVEPTAPEALAVLDAYLAAFERSDAKALERLLHEDATLEASPARTWFAGRATCAPFLAAQAMGVPGDWRMVATRANGQPAAVVYRLAADGVHRAFGIAVLTTTATEIVRIVLFGDPALVARFGFPEEPPPA
jgi:RNA polymerase sigma-70 factor (ECF subfamily)